jgi:hypothetical protein
LCKGVGLVAGCAWVPRLTTNPDTLDLYYNS